MRYYNISITGGGGQPVVYTSHPNGLYAPPDPYALDFECDILEFPFATPAGNSFIRLWGISLQTIANAQQLNGQSITVSGGMGKGLPLANPQQAGILAAGNVWQAFGNWQGTAMTLDIYAIPGLAPAPNKAAAAGNPDLPANIVLNWKANTTLSDALSPCLQTAYPGYKVVVNINPGLVVGNDQPAYYQSLTQLSQFLNQKTKAIIGGSYPGVSIKCIGTTITAYDNYNASQQAAKEIAFTDLVGQVTWIAPQTVMATCVMRGDLEVGMMVKMPPGQIAIQAQSFSQFRQSSAIQGTFVITKLRHIGNFRQPQGTAWVTTVEAVTSVT